METVKRPYELLVRWGQDGALQGAHVQWRYVTTDGGAVVAEALSAAAPIAVGAAGGYPLADILETAQVDALAAVDAMAAERDAATAALVEVAAARDAALARVAELEAQLASVTPA